MLNKTQSTELIKSKILKEVFKDDILAEDIYINKRLILRSGAVLTDQMIHLLENYEVEAIKVVFKEDKKDFTANIDEKVSKQNALSDEEHTRIKDLFFHTLEIVGCEYRYGKLLNEEADILFLQDLFVDMFAKYHFMELLLTLKSWHYDSFLQVFDVFVLGTLVAKKLELPNIETIALGYLLHDIGKLKVSQDILQKQRKLTYAEFLLLQKHTTEGEAILRHLDQEQIAHYARSHHERLDGSGYPDQLAGNIFDPDLRLLKIVDTYSALTYLGQMSAQKALQILFRDDKQYDEALLYQFIEELEIYPLHATVALTDKSVAKVVYVSKLMPTVPAVQRLDDNNKISLPLNYSLMIEKLIDFQPETVVSYLENLRADILEANSDKAIEDLSYLIDDMYLEDIYTKILLPMYWETVDLLKKDVICKEAFQTSSGIIRGLLDNLEAEIIQENNCKSKVLLVIDPKLTDRLSIKFLIDLLHLENIFPLVIQTESDPNIIASLLKEHQIEDVCFIHKRKQTKLPIIANARIEQITDKELKTLLKEITALERQSLKLFGRLFSRPLIAQQT